MPHLFMGTEGAVLPALMQQIGVWLVPEPPSSSQFSWWNNPMAQGVVEVMMGSSANCATELPPFLPGRGPRSPLMDVIPIVVCVHCCWIPKVHVRLDGCPFCVGYVCQSHHSKIHPAVVDLLEGMGFAIHLQGQIHDVLIILPLSLWFVTFIKF